MHPLIDKIRAAGVVGAGGAGFPTHAKYDTLVDTLIANGAECEPLLYKDKELMRLFPEEVKRGMKLATAAVGATRSVLAIKSKNHEIISQFRGLFGGTNLEIFEMGDHYPAGDEYVLVYEATGRLIPYGGYPVNIGCAVSNVETLLNVTLAALDIPVTEKFVTITGAVKRPVTIRVPIGTPFSDLLAFAGGPTVDSEIGILDGGAMMGRLLNSMTHPVTKTSSGYIVLPANHHLVKRRQQTTPEMKKIGQSACDQCSYCTEYCPRYLLGYQIEPHRVMRALGFAGGRDDLWGTHAVNCCECNLCSLYACPENLDPKQACVRAKINISLKELKYTPPQKELSPHPMQAHRKVTIPRLIRRLGLMEYNVSADYVDEKITPLKVTIPLKQHLGASSEPTVGVGDSVTVGQLIGAIPKNSLGANIHASINGRVTAVDECITIE